MFKLAILTASIPGEEEIGSLEQARQASFKLRPDEEEWYDEYEKLAVDLRLKHEGVVLGYDELTRFIYCGQHEDALVFAMTIGDAAPPWMQRLAQLDDHEVPIHGESAYIVTSTAPGNQQVYLYIYSGDSATWNCEALAPFDDEQLEALVKLIEQSSA